MLGQDIQVKVFFLYSKDTTFFEIGFGDIKKAGFHQLC